MSVKTRIEKLERQVPEWDMQRAGKFITDLIRSTLRATDDEGRELPPETGPMPVIPPESDVSFWGPPDDPVAEKFRIYARDVWDIVAAERASARQGRAGIV